jgi:predicted secreted hydrolase
MMKTWVAGLIGLLVLNGLVYTAEWAVPDPETRLTFPRDHGSHADFKIEWWYVTGHFKGRERRFGFQATFFRLGQRPGDPESGEFRSDQIYMAHMGISDPDNGVFLHEERLNREGWDAFSSDEDLDMRNGNWTLWRDGEVLHLIGGVGADAGFELEMKPSKGPVIFGEDGISRKGPEGTAASYYITFPRLMVSGRLRFNGDEFSVNGSGWMDHEISSSQLDRSQTGWNWACFQFDDGREIMGYVLRTEDGGYSSYSKLVWIDEEGKLTHLTLRDYDWIQDGAWTSPDTGATYPTSPEIHPMDPATGERRRFKLIPTMSEQEMAAGAGGISYWEGACDILDLDQGKVVGKAFLEMTGYADDIAERLR